MRCFYTPTAADLARLIANLGPRVGDYAVVLEQDGTFKLQALAGTSTVECQHTSSRRRLICSFRLDLDPEDAWIARSDNVRALQAEIVRALQTNLVAA